MDGFVDEAHWKNIRKGEVLVPAWIVDDPAAATGTDMGTALYWRTACGTETEPCEVRPGVLEYFRSAKVPYAPNQEKEAFRIWTSSREHALENADIPEELTGFLFSQRRWMSGPVGDLRMTRDPEAGLIYDPLDEEIMGDQAQWLELMYEFNTSRPSELEKRRKLLTKMLGKMGEGCYIEPPFRANWAGKNLYLGNDVNRERVILIVNIKDMLPWKDYTRYP